MWNNIFRACIGGLIESNEISNLITSLPLQARYVLIALCNSIKQLQSQANSPPPSMGEGGGAAVQSRHNDVKVSTETMAPDGEGENATYFVNNFSYFPPPLNPLPRGGCVAMSF